MKVLLIGEDGKTIGNLEYKDAEDIARSSGKSMIMVNKQKNIYKIGDLGRVKYEQKQKEKLQRAQQRAQKIKEIKLRPVIDSHDMDTKYNHIISFLEGGLKTKIIMSFHGRHIANKEIGMEKFNTLLNRVLSVNICSKDKEPAFEGKNLIVVLSPSK